MTLERCLILPTRVLEWNCFFNSEMNRCFKFDFGPARCRLSPVPAVFPRMFRERRDISGERPPDLCGSCGSCSDGTFYVFAGRDNRQYRNEVRWTLLSLPWGNRAAASCLCRCSAASSRSRITRGSGRLTPGERRHRPGSITPAGCTETGEAPNMSTSIHPCTLKPSSKVKKESNQADYVLI